MINDYTAPSTMEFGVHILQRFATHQQFKSNTNLVMARCAKLFMTLLLRIPTMLSLRRRSAVVLRYSRSWRHRVLAIVIFEAQTMGLKQRAQRDEPEDTMVDAIRDHYGAQNTQIAMCK